MRMSRREQSLIASLLASVEEISPFQLTLQKSPPLRLMVRIRRKKRAVVVISKHLMLKVKVTNSLKNSFSALRKDVLVSCDSNLNFYF